MRTQEFDMNKVVDNTEVGEVTIVKMVRMDTTNNEEAKKFAEEYARENGLKLFSVYMGIHKWYTGMTGRYAYFYKA
jgi:hypothetical protein